MDKFELRKSDFDLDKLIEDCFLLISFQAESRGLSIRFVKDEDVPTIIYNDAERLKQIILNLLLNAIKYTPEGEIVVRISLSEWQNEVAIRIDVEDTGIGIPDNKIKGIFRLFGVPESNVNTPVSGKKLKCINELLIVSGWTRAINQSNALSENRLQDNSEE